MELEGWQGDLMNLSGGDPKEPLGPKTHWDHVLEETVWLSKIRFLRASNLSMQKHDVLQIPCLGSKPREAVWEVSQVHGTELAMFLVEKSVSLE
ncbi:hypothetical protein Vadar_013323 [Vaccinium darrowii]|uniref:Uncharacterized protein n=1 Tax=Vaccinium darrowii TaxID=229202 RepID=A0ACB7ZB83_9ERIC|nr:hypothetical protein Vadar_013323 [Vaccinium darrowii]